MKRSNLCLAASLVAMGLLVAGCGRVAPPGDSDGLVDAVQEHRHDSGHTHTHGQGHEHVDPLHGGQTVAIGHSHHANGETYYHAEVMPLIDGQITFHVLTENAEGKGETLPVEAATIAAYVDRVDKEGSRAEEVAFTSPDEPGGSTFVAAVPESLLDCEQLSVVVPKIELGGERLSFSFTATKTDQPAQAETPAPSE